MTVDRCLAALVGLLATAALLLALLAGDDLLPPRPGALHAPAAATITRTASRSLPQSAPLQEGARRWGG